MVGGGKKEDKKRGGRARIPICAGDVAAASWSTMTVREGTMTVTVLTPGSGRSSFSTRGTSEGQQIPSTSK